MPSIWPSIPDNVPAKLFKMDLSENNVMPTLTHKIKKPIAAIMAAIYKITSIS